MPPMRRAPYDLGALDDAYDTALGCACDDVNGVEDLLPGSAAKGATIGAAAGSIIPGVGTVIGGAVGAAAGAVADLFKGIGGGRHCEMAGKEVPCPDCKITDIECFKRWAMSKKKEAEEAAAKARGPSPLELLRRTQAAAAARRPKPAPRPALRRPMALVRAQSPMMDGQPEHSHAVPIAIGAAALAAAGGGAWWWWKRRNA